MFSSQIHDDFAEFFEGRFEVFDDRLGENIGIGKVVGFGEASETISSRLMKFSLYSPMQARRSLTSTRTASARALPAGPVGRLCGTERAFCPASGTRD
jgi:hypothetical protein